MKALKENQFFGPPLNESNAEFRKKCTKVFATTKNTQIENVIMK